MCAAVTITTMAKARDMRLKDHGVFIVRRKDLCIPVQSSGPSEYQKKPAL